MNALGTGMLLVSGSLLTHQFESMIVRHYGKKYANGGIFFNAMICLFAVVYFLFTDKGGLQFPQTIWIYGLINSATYAIGFYAGYMAFKTGSFGLTRLFTSFGVIISTLYGILFLKEPTTAYTYIALVLILLSLFLMNYQKNDDSPKQEISLKWIIYVTLTVLSNAAIAILGKAQHAQLGDAYTNEFLIITYIGASVALLLFSVMLERQAFGSHLLPTFLLGAGAGIFNAISNFFTLITYNYLPISFISPVKTGVGMVLGFVLSMGLYKEKFSRRQFVAIGIGIIAVIIMSLKF